MDSIIILSRIHKLANIIFISEIYNAVKSDVLYNLRTAPWFFSRRGHANIVCRVYVWGKGEGQVL